MLRGGVYRRPSYLRQHVRVAVHRQPDLAVAEQADRSEDGAYRGRKAAAALYGRGYPTAETADAVYDERTRLGGYPGLEFRSPSCHTSTMLVAIMRGSS